MPASLQRTSRIEAPKRKRKVSLRARSGRRAKESLQMLFEGSDIDAARAASALGLSKTQLAETIGIAREVFYKRERREAPRTQARLREMLEILVRVSAWAGGAQQALAWYRAQPLAAFGGRTAESLVKSGHATSLRDYLDHIAVGGYA